MGRGGQMDVKIAASAKIASAKAGWKAEAVFADTAKAIADAVFGPGSYVFPPQVSILSK